MNARMERKSASHDITFCVSECKDKCMRHISNYEFADNEKVSMCNFDCVLDIKESYEAIQYFRENLDWFHSLEIDTDKLKTVLNLAEKGINLEKIISKIKELEKEFKFYTGKDYSNLELDDEVFYDDKAYYISTKIDTLCELLLELEE